MNDVVQAGVPTQVSGLVVVINRVSHVCLPFDCKIRKLHINECARLGSKFPLRERNLLGLCDAFMTIGIKIESRNRTTVVEKEKFRLSQICHIHQKESTHLNIQAFEHELYI